MVSIENLISDEYFIFFLILFAAILIAKFCNLFLKIYLNKIAKRTKSDIDDIVIENIKKPLYTFILFIGGYFALKSLSILTLYASWIDRIFFVGMVLAVSFVVVRLLKVLISRWLKVEKKFEKTPKLVNKIVAVIIYLVAFLIILSYFKIEINPMVAALGLGGLAIGLALQDTLSNLFAGLHIISDRSINVGDFIELKEGDTSGYVDDIGWRSTKIRTLPNTMVIIPNSKLAGSITINNSMPENEMAALVQCGVAYGSNLKNVEKATVDVARNIQKTVTGAVRTFEPFIRYHTFGNSNINFTVILRVEKFVDKYLVIHEFIKELKERYDKEKIEISWPVRKIYHGK